MARSTSKVGTARRGLSWVLAAALLAIGSGCGVRASEVREVFAEDNNCPEDRVEVKKRSDLSAWSVSTGGLVKKPPPDVAADPERLAMWQKKRKQLQKNSERNSWVFEARGCGQEAILVCGTAHSAGKMSRGADIASVSCTGETKAMAAPAGEGGAAIATGSSSGGGATLPACDPASVAHELGV